MKKIIILSVALTSVMALGGLSPDLLAETAKANYSLYCAQCHGVRGNGAGINKADMPVAPRNHTDTAGMARLKDSDIYNAISQGGAAVGKSTLMPPWSAIMTDTEIKEMVAYLRELCNCKGE
ncbi:MAG: c-type cytochrome [Nitrospinota bacterium]